MNTNGPPASTYFPTELSNYIANNNANLDKPVEEQDPAVVAHIVMHDGPEGIRSNQNKIRFSLLKKIRSGTFS